MLCTRLTENVKRNKFPLFLFLQDAFPLLFFFSLSLSLSLGAQTNIQHPKSKERERERESRGKKRGKIQEISTLLFYAIVHIL